MELNKKNTKKIMLIIAFGIILFFTIQNIPFFINFIAKFLSLIFPFILGLCIAFILNVPMSLIENKLLKKIKNKKIKRILSIILAILLVILIIIFVLILVIPDFINAISSLINILPESFERFSKWIDTIIKEYPEIKEGILSIDWQNITNNIINFLKISFDLLLSNSIKFISSFISSILSLILGIIFSIYILAQKETLANQINKVMKAYLPKKLNDKILHISKISNNTFSKFISVQCLEAVILGSMFFIALTIFKFPYALAISSLITICALIPVFGAFIACAFGMILIGITNPMQSVWFFILFQIIQQIEGNLIYPKVVGKSVGLPAIWVMLAVTVGGNAFGLIGMLISVPISSVLYTLIKENVNERLKED